MANKQDQNEWFKLLIKKNDPNLYYKTLDIIDMAKSKKQKIVECSDCGYVYVGKKPDDCVCKTMKALMLWA